jgi:transposase
MLKERRAKQQQMDLVILEQLIPEDHLLRKVERAVDFSFIYPLCAPLYCEDNGRPAINPEVLFRMLFIGYLYGIKSEVRLEEEVNYNMAYKWFCGLGVTEKAPDATTISQNRRRRFRDNDIAEQIFNEILRQCVAKGLVGGAILYTDSTHIKAKANKHKKQLVTVEATPKAYMEELDAQVDQDRKTLEKKPFNRDDPPKGGGTTTRMKSTTDPDSGQQCRDGKPDGFHYSEHRTVDSKRNVIVNVHVEPANMNDVTPIPKILEEIEQRLGKLPEYMGLDAGYHNAWIAHLLERKGIQGVIGYRRHTHKGVSYGKYRFRYDDEFDAYICPEKHHLYWRTTTREGYRQYYIVPVISDQEGSNLS